MSSHLLSLALLFSQTPDDPTAFINRALAGQWQAQKLTPADRTSDLEFLRRASLDLIGRIPTLKEQRAYMQDAPPERRKLLVDRLLAHDDYARHWANVWTGWLLGSSGEAGARQAFHGWLHKHFARNGSHKEMAEKLLLAKGNTRDNPAAHFLVTLRGQAMPEKEWNYGQHDMVPATAVVFRALHGRRLQCVQCHDHPFNDGLNQGRFRDMNVFFRQVRFTAKAVGANKVVEEISDDPDLNKNPSGLYEGRIPGHFVAPRFYDGDTWKPGMKQTRREFFTERVIKHPDFARAHVNFLWATLLGHGLMESREFDDFGEHNPVIQEKIMARLAAEFIKSGHDSKALLRWICLSDAYSLKSAANKTNDGPDQAVYFSRMIARPLSRPQLVESLMVALTMENYVERRDGLREELLAEFAPLPPLPSCEVTPVHPEGELSMWQALWLINGSVWSRESSAPDGTVAKLLAKVGGASQKNVGKFLEEIYPIVLCRAPSSREMKHLTDDALHQGLRGAGAKLNTPQYWRSYCEDIFWALANSAEFALNH